MSSESLVEVANRCRKYRTNLRVFDIVVAITKTLRYCFTSMLIRFSFVTFEAENEIGAH